MAKNTLDPPTTPKRKLRYTSDAEISTSPIKKLSIADNSSPSPNKAAKAGNLTKDLKVKLESSSDREGDSEGDNESDNESDNGASPEEQEDFAVVFKSANGKFGLIVREAQENEILSYSYAVFEGKCEQNKWYRTSNFDITTSKNYSFLGVDKHFLIKSAKEINSNIKIPEVPLQKDDVMALDSVNVYEKFISGLLLENVYFSTFLKIIRQKARHLFEAVDIFNNRFSLFVADAEDELLMNQGCFYAPFATLFMKSLRTDYESVFFLSDAAEKFLFVKDPLTAIACPLNQFLEREGPEVRTIEQINNFVEEHSIIPKTEFTIKNVKFSKSSFDFFQLDKLDNFSYLGCSNHRVKLRVKFCEKCNAECKNYRRFFMLRAQLWQPNGSGHTHELPVILFHDAAVSLLQKNYTDPEDFNEMSEDELQLFHQDIIGDIINAIYEVTIKLNTQKWYLAQHVVTSLNVVGHS